MISKKRAPTTKREVASFTVPSPCWQAVAQVEYATGADEEDAAPWCEKAQALHLAKKQATASFSRMSMQPGDARLQDSWTKDERNVLRARADLLHTLMTAEADPKICLEVTDSKPARVCVMYNRMRCEGDVELGPMQSTMSWVVHGAEQSYQQLVTMGEHAQASVLGRLLQETHRSMPANKEVLQALSRLLVRPAPDRLLQAGLGQGGGCTRVMRGSLVSSGQHPEYEIAWGALDVNVQEAWQNPSTNAAIRLSVLEATHQATREASRTKLPLWSNTAYLQVRIRHNDECHNLMFTPFCDSEACTVSHVQFAQSVFDHSGPERGILNLGQNPDAIHAIPLGTVTPMRAYVCLKAHKANRLNEAQLNYVHSRGLLQHRGFDTRLLPAPEKLFTTCKAAMPPAKSTRVSGMGVDVMASSYHLADQVYTTITVVQYPPFGTQFGASSRVANSFKNGLLAEGEDEDPSEDPEEFPDEDIRDGNEDPSDDPEISPDAELHNAGHRPPMDKDDPVLAKVIRRKWNPLSDKGIIRHKPDKWREPLKQGQMYFIDSYLGDPYNLDHRLTLIEVDNGQRYKKVQQELITIRDGMLQQFYYQWNPLLSFHENIQHNDEIKTFWRRSWKKFLLDHMHNLDLEVRNYREQHGLPPDSPRHVFWYCNVADPMRDIYKNLMTAADKTLWDTEGRVDEKSTFGKMILKRWTQTKTWVNYWQEKGMLSAHTLAVISGNIRSSYGQTRIPIPRALPTSPATKTAQEAVRTLQCRICALESKLQRASNNKNTQALLERVLERLEEA